MIVAIGKNTFAWVQQTKESNNTSAYVGPTKVSVRNAIEEDGLSLKDFVFFTEKTRAK